MRLTGPLLRSRFGNDLYTGRRSIDFVGRQRLWYALSGAFVVLALFGIFARGLNLGIEFNGGSEFRVSQVGDTNGYEDKARAAIGTAGIPGDINTSVITDSTNGQQTVRVQTAAAGDKSDAAASALGKEFGVPASQVSSSFIDASWGQGVTSEAIRALVIFLILVALVMAAYFRTWKMAAAGLIALLHDLLITVGIYALSGLQITPASMIGFLTILGYSLYDTVVVFDKVRENTTEAVGSRRRSFAQAANLAVNQTLVRSINTTVVALLPIAAVLFVGFTMLGPGTLLDLSLALFIGIGVGAYSSIFIATPLFVDMKNSEPDIKKLAKQAERLQARQAVTGQPTPLAAAASPEVLDGGPDPDEQASLAPLARRPVHKYAQPAGPRNQPRRAPKSKR